MDNGLEYTNIHITGSPRTGTTLMQNLMGSFEDTYVCPFEIAPTRQDVIAAMRGTSTDKGVEKHRVEGPFPVFRYLVTKHPINGIKVSVFFEDVIKDVRKYIVMVRDIRDFVCSVAGPNPPPDADVWADRPTIWGVLKLTGITDVPGRLVVVRYEDLVKDPDAIQEKIEDNFGLVRKWSFAEAHKHLTPHPVLLQKLSSTSRRVPGEMRSIGTESVGIWKTHNFRTQAEALFEKPEIQEFMGFFYPELFEKANEG